MTTAEALALVRTRIAAACDRAGRFPDEVTLVAVAKSFPVDRIGEAIEAGARDIGENRAQELRDKASVLGDAVRWHFIGPLQTNKVRQVVGVASLIHSVDRFGLGEAIARRARSIGVTQDILVEVNIAGETSKAGVEPPRALALAEELAGLDGVRVKGLMAIPPVAATPEAARVHFATLARLLEDIASRVDGVTELSMGMTGDFEVAISEGATLVRIGRAIFGPRSR